MTVKFVKHSMKTPIYGHKKKLKAKSLLITEALTSVRMSLMKQLAALR